MLYLSGIIITFFLSLLLISKKNKSLADKILAAWLTCTGLHLTFFYIYTSGHYKSFPYFLGVEIAMPLLQGPFLFLYTTAITQAKKITWHSSLHFLPFVAVLGILLPFFSLTFAHKIQVYQNGGEGYETLTGAVLIALSISGVIYITLAFILLRKHSRLIRQQFSNTDKINLNWLRYLIGGTAVIWVVILAGLADSYIFGAVVIYVFFLGFFGVKQVGVFSNIVPATNQLTERMPVKTTPLTGIPGKIMDQDARERVAEAFLSGREKAKYRHSTLNPVEGGKIYAQLQLLMNSRQLFTSPELTLADLARELQIHPNILSQVINTYAQKSFYDYINDLRIQAFKIMLSNPGNKQYTLLGLAFACGFNSKTAFNRNFKKATGLSPTQYIQQLNTVVGNTFISEA